jgi:hypothetical protein
LLECIHTYIKAFQDELLKDPQLSVIYGDIVDRLIPALFSSQKKGINTSPELESIKEIVLEMVQPFYVTTNYPKVQEEVRHIGTQALTINDEIK